MQIQCSQCRCNLIVLTTRVCLLFVGLLRNYLYLQSLACACFVFGSTFNENNACSLYFWYSTLLWLFRRVADRITSRPAVSISPSQFKLNWNLLQCICIPICTLIFNTHTNITTTCLDHLTLEFICILPSNEIVFFEDLFSKRLWQRCLFSNTFYKLILLIYITVNKHWCIIFCSHYTWK